ALLLTVLGLAGLLTAQLGPNRHHIENDLAHRSAQALTAAGQDGAKVSFTGRDALVVAESQARADRAAPVVAGIRGVRAVRVTVEAPAVRPPSTFALAAAAGRATLTGTVPADGTGATLHDAAAATFGTIDDRVTVDDRVAADATLTA